MTSTAGPAVRTLTATGWTTGDGPTELTQALESGELLFFPGLAFHVEPSEARFFSSGLVAAAKNVSFDPRTGRVSGTTLSGPDARGLRDLVARFSGLASSFAGQLLPVYRDGLQIARASFRPVEIAGRASSWRKDDTRLHIDSFPATPVQGRRILRVFTNVNPQGRPRTWRIGEEFERVADRFSKQLRLPLPGAGALLRLLRVTKSSRSPYDALMLQLHDRMKADLAYQAAVAQTTIEFPAGSTWMGFTDQVSHAAMAGQYQLEQTFLLPVEAMRDPDRSPLRVLERLMRRSLL